jgi:hypothetical protein
MARTVSLVALRSLGNGQKIEESVKQQLFSQFPLSSSERDADYWGSPEA